MKAHLQTPLMGGLAALLVGLTLSLAAPAASAAPLRADAVRVEAAGPATMVRHMDHGRHYGWSRGRHRGHHRHTR